MAQVVNTPLFRGNNCLNTCRSFRTTAPSTCRPKLSSAAVIWRSMSVFSHCRWEGETVRERTGHPPSSGFQRVLDARTNKVFGCPPSKQIHRPKNSDDLFLVIYPNFYLHLLT